MSTGRAIYEAARRGGVQALGLAMAFHEALARAVVHTLMAPDRYGGKFRLQVLVCDFDGLKMAEADSSISQPT